MLARGGGALRPCSAPHPTPRQALALLPSADFKAGGNLTRVSVSSSFPGCVFVGAWTQGAERQIGVLEGQGEAREESVLRCPPAVLVLCAVGTEQAFAQVSGENRHLKLWHRTFQFAGRIFSHRFIG